MKTSVTFKSTLFLPFLPEESQVNPECYGAELAWWLSRKLAEKSVITSYPSDEDWGWFLEYTQNDSEYWLCCGNKNGSKDEWHVFLEAKSKGLFHRKKAPIEKATLLLDELACILVEEKGITDIEWE